MAPNCQIHYNQKNSTQVKLNHFGCHIFLETVELRRSRNRYDPWLLGQEPGERDLGYGRDFTPCNAAKQVNQLGIGLTGLRRESGHDVAKIGAVESRGFVDCSSGELKVDLNQNLKNAW